jgi:o-succinylbenzoate---CoA ligase
MSYFETLTLNGTAYSGDELRGFIDAKLNSDGLKEYEKSLYSFIKEWISYSNVIRVQTSGTTGEPKAITFTKLQAVASAQMTCKYFGLNKNTNALMSLSSEFIGGKMMVVRAFISGMNLIIIEPNSSPLDGVKERIDFASMVPFQVHNCLADEKTKQKFLSIPDVIVGGAPISPLLESMLANCTNNVYATFAMTETLSHIALKRLSGADRKDYYELLPGISILVDERGCLVINAPSLNENSIVTNDVVEIINPAQFLWLGRYDNVINSGGIKIYPEIVEYKLAALILNHRFFISSIPDEKLGQKVVMVIEGVSDFDVATIKNQAGKTLSKYEMPKEYFIIDRFLETVSGKVKKGDTLKIAAKI